MSSVARAAYGTPIEHIEGRRNGDSFVGSPELKLYNANPRTNPVWRFGEKIEYNKKRRKLMVPAFLLHLRSKFLSIPVSSALSATALCSSRVLSSML
jgi:hypothetical protein